MAKKWLKCSFPIMLSLLILSACSGGAGNSSGTTDNQATPGGAAATEKKDAGPLSIEILTNFSNTIPKLDDGYYTELQKLTNTKLNITFVLDGNDYNSKLDLVLASGDIPEVLKADFTRPTLVNAINEGAFWDLTPLLGDFSKYPNLRDNMVPGSWNYVKYDGKIMGIPRSRAVIDNTIMFRKDWLDKLNISLPKTVDEYKEALKAVVKNNPAGGNGTIGYVIADATGSESLRAAFGVVTPTYDADGGLIYLYLNPQATQMVEWFRGLYAEGLIPKEFSTLTVTQQKDLFSSGRAFAFDASAYYSFVYTDNVKKTQPEGNVVSSQPLKGPGGDGALLNMGTRGGQYISKKVPQEKVLQILNFFEKTASKELTDLGYYGKEGLHYNNVNGEKVLTDLGKKEITVDTIAATTPAYSKWGKVSYAGASKADNDAKQKEMEIYEKVGKTDVFGYLYSPAWIDVWPTYEKELQSMRIKAVVGQITMEQYKQYVDKVNADPKVKKAYQEFAKDLKSRMQK
ncbi:extracellular solute-binding protein [Paenibacillus agricola]|uniref:Extracellular solute-binding protein n=1 Tax=Paenibacillus agricola TaxID=2716264 RepID=A0ABX0IYQ6_9BACL|nr:extracellular solute-binding protein [Paenibacillus agricola]NHN29012.1 extracellular solute-binding protein [Paenibacillus agricola]